MAGKKNLEADYPSFDMDLDLDFSTDISSELNQEVNEPKKRTVIGNVAKGVLQGTKDTLTSPQFIHQTLKKALPSAYGEITESLGEVSQGSYELYDQTVRELKPRVNRIMSKIDSMVPETQKGLKSITKKIVERTGTSTYADFDNAQAGGNADGANGSAKALSFGRRDRAVYHNLDEIAGRLVRLGNDMAMIGNATPNRAALRLVELKCEPIAAPSDEEQQFGPEYIVRLRGGDVLRGRVLGLDENALTLRTRFAGDLALSRETLAVLFPAGGDGRGIAWLSAAVPAKSVHTPVFDAQFPARANLSIGGNLIEFNGEPCDRGWGVHSKSELAFALDGKPGKRFVALCGIDDETAGRGAAVAKVLLDGAEAWASPELKPGEAPQFVDVELKAAKTLTLVVDYGPDNDDEADHAGWGWAAIVGK